MFYPSLWDSKSYLRSEVVVGVPSSWFGAEAWLGRATPAIAQNVGKISEAEMMPV